ncbi:MAG: flavin reductase family protein [Bacteroidota bacterium]|nr:flavin reductase family protein [Bacteroidota bacterium]
MQLSKDQLLSLDRICRLNLVNSLTGIKPANLIGTVNTRGVTNLAIFSSVIHLGSNPPLLGMVTRPLGEVRRHTYENIKETGVFTINSVPNSMTKAAHYTAAKFEDNESEFEHCGFTPEYLSEFKAPFVRESPLKMGLQLVDELPIKHNDTRLLISEIEYLCCEQEVGDGHLNLEELQLAGISGLNSYYTLEKIAEYPYPRKEEWSKD